MQVAVSTRLWAEHRHSWLHTQQEGRVRGSVHSVHRHFPHASHTTRCFFSAGEEGISDSVCWPMLGHAPPVDTCADLRSRDLEEEVQEELRPFDSEEEKHPGVRLTVLTTLWGRFGWWSTTGVGAA